MYVRTYVRMYVCIFVCLYVCMFVCLFVCNYIYMYTYAYVHNIPLLWLFVQYTTWRDLPLQCNRLHCVTLRCITVHEFTCTKQMYICVCVYQFMNLWYKYLSWYYLISWFYLYVVKIYVSMSLCHVFKYPCMYDHQRVNIIPYVCVHQKHRANTWYQPTSLFCAKYRWGFLSQSPDLQMPAEPWS